MAAQKKKVEEGEKEKKEEDVEEAIPAGTSLKEKSSEEDQEVKLTEKEVISESSTEAADLVKDEKANKKPFWIIFPVILLVGALAGGVFIYREGVKKTEKTEEQLAVVSPSPIPTETPEALPVAELKREDLKLQVLNGAGVAGTAAKAREFLEGLGYKEVAIGNADSFDYEETEVSIKEDKKDYLEMLTDDLSEEYTLSAQTPYVDKENEFDAIVVIGKK